MVPPEDPHQCPDRDPPVSDPEGVAEQAAQVRGTVYRHFLDHGHAPGMDHIRRSLGLRRDEVLAALARLSHPGDVVVSPGSGNILLAHPFSPRHSGYEVTCGDRRYWTACAQDALLLGIATDQDLTIDAPCGDCGEILRIEIRNGAVHGDAVIHCLLPASHWFDDIATTCATTLFFRDDSHARRWCDQRGFEFGATASLTAYASATRALSAGRLTPAFTPPSTADRQAAYRDAGMTDEFWILARVPGPPPATRPEDDAPPLSHREREVLARLCAGESQKQIAHALSLSRHTVDTHVRNVYAKLAVRSRASAVLEAVRRRLV